jgi:hypothetical protein
MIDIKPFREWQLAGNRSVKIQLGSFINNTHHEIHVYDYDLKVGQFVNSVDEIDLVGKLKNELQAKIAELEKLEKNNPAKTQSQEPTTILPQEGKNENHK